MENSTPTGEVIVTLSDRELHFGYDQLSVNFNSTESEIIDALQPILLEEEGFDITENQDDGLYTIKKVEQSQNVYVFPKSTAG